MEVGSEGGSYMAVNASAPPCIRSNNKPFLGKVGETHGSPTDGLLGSQGQPAIANGQGSLILEGYRLPGIGLIQQVPQQLIIETMA